MGRAGPGRVAIGVRSRQLGFALPPVRIRTRVPAGSARIGAVPVSEHGDRREYVEHRTGGLGACTEASIGLWHEIEKDGAPALARALYTYASPR